MKALLILFIILSGTFSQALAGNNSADSIKFNFKGHVVVKGKTKKELYLSSREWFIKTFNLPKDVLLVQDKDEGEIIGRCSINYNGRNLQNTLLAFGIVYFTCTVKANDGGFDYSFTDFIHVDAFGVPSGGNLNNKKPYAGTGNLLMNTWRNIKIKVFARAQYLEKSLKDYMSG